MKTEIVSGTARLNFEFNLYITHNKNGGNITMAIRNIRTIGDEMLAMKCKTCKGDDTEDKDTYRGYARYNV